MAKRRTKKSITPKGRITPEQRSTLKEVNALLKAARAGGLLSQSKPLLELNRAAKAHKNKRLSEKDFKRLGGKIERILYQTKEGFLNLLEERKRKAKERRIKSKGISELQEKTKKVYEEIKKISPYISHQAAEIAEIMEEISDPSIRKKMTLKEVREAKKKINDYVTNFEAHKKEIEKGMRNYARLWGISETDLYDPEVIQMIEDLEDYEESDEWYAAVVEVSEDPRLKKARENEFENIEDMIEAAEENEEEANNYYTEGDGSENFFKP